MHDCVGDGVVTQQPRRVDLLACSDWWEVRAVACTCWKLTVCNATFQPPLMSKGCWRRIACVQLLAIEQTLAACGQTPVGQYA